MNAPPKTSAELSSTPASPLTVVQPVKFVAAELVENAQGNVIGVPAASLFGANCSETIGNEINKPEINAPTTHLLTRVNRGDLRLNMAPAHSNNSEPIV